jgi:hypothetical protein
MSDHLSGNDAARQGAHDGLLASIYEESFRTASIDYHKYGIPMPYATPKQIRALRR